MMSHNLNDEREQLEAAEFAAQDDAEAELARLTALLEDRPSLAMRIRMAIYEWDNNVELQKMEHSTFVADRLIAYLKGVKS